jgi:hypothetical protein
MSAVDTYHVIAKYYDAAYAAKQDLVDLPFYLDLAEKSKGPVLEIACGTGRVLRPIARKGIEICGAAVHLTDQGTLAFDVFYPKFEMIWTKVGEEVPEMEWTPSSDPTTIVRRFFRKDSIDKINQIFAFTFIFRTYQTGKLVQEETEPFRLCYYTYPHLRALFQLAGLEPTAEYGSFAKTPLDNTAEQMIFLLRNL